MDSSDVPEPEYDFVERLLIRAGLVGFVLGLTFFYAILYALWRSVGRHFFGA
jgi:hypothetical protein